MKSLALMPYDCEEPLTSRQLLQVNFLNRLSWCKPDPFLDRRMGVPSVSKDD